MVSIQIKGILLYCSQNVIMMAFSQKMPTFPNNLQEYAVVYKT